MDLDQQPSSSRTNVGQNGRDFGRTLAGMEKNLTPTTPTLTPMQSSSLSADTKMKTLAAEMQLLNDFFNTKHGVMVLDVNSDCFKTIHAPSREVDRIKRSLDASLTGTPQTERKTNDDLDETLIVVKQEPNWAEEDTLVVDPGEQDSDSDERTDSLETNIATVSVSEGSGLNVEPSDASLLEPTHTREKPFQCENCGAKFGSKANKVKHMRIHTGEKPFQCEYCEKWFNDKSNLLVHLRIHTGEKPCSCSTCEKAFNQSINLQNHEKTHHK